MKKIKTIGKDSFYYVDPTGLTPVSSGANADMLLYTPRAQVHEKSINKKALFFKKASLLAPDFGPWWTISALCFQYNRLQTIVNSNFVDNFL